MGITEIEAVARALCPIPDCVNRGHCTLAKFSEVCYLEHEIARKAIHAYESTPRQQARNEVVEAARLARIACLNSALDENVALESLWRALDRLAELESGDG